MRLTDHAGLLFPALYDAQNQYQLFGQQINISCPANNKLAMFGNKFHWYLRRQALGPSLYLVADRCLHLLLVSVHLSKL